MLTIKITCFIDNNLGVTEKTLTKAQERVLSGATRIRTGDTRIFSPLLYQLSYSTINLAANINTSILSIKEKAGLICIIHTFGNYI